MDEMTELIDVLKAINNNLATLTYSNLAIAEELNRLRFENVQEGPGSDWTMKTVIENNYGENSDEIRPEYL